MATLIADFKSDLLDMARQHLEEEWGPEEVPSERSGDRALALFIDSLRRRPAVRPRVVWEADDFYCPPEVASGWDVLREKVVKGNDLGPHLSERHSSLTNLDGLLNEWGVNHLHLGAGPWPKNSLLADRTGPLLFAFITDDDCYAINIYEHGDWERNSIVESLHRNWPQVIAGWRIIGVKGEVLSEKQRRRVRSLNAQAAMAVTDGTVYQAIGGGVMVSGISFQAMSRADRICVDVERLQDAVQQQLDRFIVHLRPRGYPDGLDVRAKLVGITPQVHRVLFSDYAVLADVTLEKGER
ncbi:MAG: hypothetical protein ABSF98_19810 [Bryobacteraceae bacterium]